MFSYTFSSDTFQQIVDVKFHDKDNNLVEKRMTFLDENMRAIYVTQLMFEYLSRKFRNYVIHAMKVSMGSNHAKYTDPKRKEAIDKLMVMVRRLQSSNLPMLAMYIRMMAEDLERVLPIESNPSYQSSIENYKELMHFAKQLKPTSFAT